MVYSLLYPNLAPFFCRIHSLINTHMSGFFSCHSCSACSYFQLNSVTRFSTFNSKLQLERRLQKNIYFLVLRPYGLHIQLELLHISALTLFVYLLFYIFVAVFSNIYHFPQIFFLILSYSTFRWKPWLLLHRENGDHYISALIYPSV